MAHALGDEGGLEVRVRDDAPVVDAPGELERRLDVLARGLEVALAAAAARAPAEDVGAEEVARAGRSEPASARASSKSAAAVATLESL